MSNDGSMVGLAYRHDQQETKVIGIAYDDAGAAMVIHQVPTKPIRVTLLSTFMGVDLSSGHPYYLRIDNNAQQ